MKQACYQGLVFFIPNSWGQMCFEYLFLSAFVCILSYFTDDTTQVKVRMLFIFCSFVQT